MEKGRTPEIRQAVVKGTGTRRLSSIAVQSRGAASTQSFDHLSLSIHLSIYIIFLYLLISTGVRGVLSADLLVTSGWKVHPRSVPSRSRRSLSARRS
jgi:hypothetical protein